MVNNISKRGQKGRLAKINNKINEQKNEIPQVVVAPTPPEPIIFEKRDRKKIGLAMIELQKRGAERKKEATLETNFSIDQHGTIKETEKINQPEPLVPKEASVEYRQDIHEEAQNKYFKGSIEVNTSIYSQEAFDLGGNQGGIRFHSFNSAGEFPAKKH